MTYPRDHAKILEFFNQSTIKSDWKTQYIRYRLGRLKHQYWLWNRKRKKNFLVDSHDYFILKNCQPGTTAFFASSGYYLKQIWPEITVIEMHPVVASFYPEVIICADRSELTTVCSNKFDNFAVVNNRADLWVDTEGLTQHLENYTKVMNLGCRFFYSFRDTQIIMNRLKTNMEKYFFDWACSLEKILGLQLVWYDINFRKKNDQDNDTLENPDTTNGNLKFIFSYKGSPWTIKPL